MNNQDFKAKLTPEQYRIVKENGTETPFQNEFWDHKKPGLYVDIISGKPLFSSKEKFDSGCGWPSFTEPIAPESVFEKTDSSHSMNRTEVRSRCADNHLGHVFDDGPGPNHLRYCINSAALRFVPLSELEAKGYGEFLEKFDDRDFLEAGMGAE